MTKTKLCLFGVPALFVTAGTHVLLSQTASSTLSGRVADIQGAAVVGASVQLTSIERGTAVKVMTNSAGRYTFSGVQAGNYKLVVESPGFKQAEADNLVVDVGSLVEQNLMLQNGEASERVVVTANEAVIDTVSGSVDSVVAGPPIQDLPLNGRDTLSLAITEPGVTPIKITTTGFAGSGGGANNSGFSIAGGRPNSVTYVLDGGNNNSVSNSTAIVNPNPDTIAEFRIITNNYTAEFGRSNGGIVNEITKSGANTIHGTVYDYFRNKVLNANTFFNNAQGTPRGVLIRNQFGGTMGGPISIPHVFTGKDRFFWFMGYQGQRQRAAQASNNIIVPTPAQLNGDFSSSYNGGVDPGVAQFLQNHPYYQADPSKQLLGVIDPTKINTIAKSVIANEPFPTSTSGRLTSTASATDNRDEFVGKLDFNVTSKERLSFTVVRNHNPTLNPFPYANVPGYASQGLLDDYFANITLDSTITPSLLNEFHATVSRVLSQSGLSSSGLTTAPGLGIKITPDISTGPPQMSFTTTGLALGLTASSPGIYADTTYTFTENLMWNHGHHEFKFGGVYGIVQNNGNFAYETNGNYSFTGAGGVGTGQYSSGGNDFADFLLGIPTAFGQYPNAHSGAHGFQAAGYGQDTWKITHDLTLTLGARYEYNSPKYDPSQRNYMVIPGAHSTKFPLAPTGLMFPCDPGAPCRGVSFPDKNNFAPRFGFAYNVGGKGKTSIRGGIGAFYDVLNGQDVQWQNGTAPFYSSAAINFSKTSYSATAPSNAFSDPYGTGGQINPFPSKPLAATTNFATAGFLPLGPSSVFIDPYQRNPYTLAYNFTVQQSLSNGVVFQVGYVGTESRKLVINLDPNSFLPNTKIRPLNQQADPNYTNPWSYFSVDKTVGNANYNGLLTQLTKRTGDLPYFGSVYFTAGYTWSKNMADQDAYLQNTSSRNTHQFYAPALFDVTNRFVLSGGWELPFAKAWTHGPSRLTKGWSLFPIFSWQTGTPADFTAGVTRSASKPGPAGDGDSGLVRPNQMGKEKRLDPHKVASYTVMVNGAAKTVSGRFFLDPTVMSTPSCFANTTDIPNGSTATACPAPTYGTMQRDAMRGMPLTNFDLSLEKKTQLLENLNLVFRAEFFNVLNHTEFLTPTTSTAITSGSVGQAVNTDPARIGQLALKLVF